MLSVAHTLDRFDQGGSQETFVQIRLPRHKIARKLMAFWLTRPGDSVLIGRDIPSNEIAPLFGNLTVWEPVGDGQDYVLRHMGDTLRMRLSLHFPAGRLMSELLSPEFYAYHRSNFPTLAKAEDIEVLDVLQGLSGSNCRHFEVVTFAAQAPHTKAHWMVSGAFYF